MRSRRGSNSKNPTGAFLCIRRALPTMREARYGRIINVGSNSGKLGSLSGVTAYAASFITAEVMDVNGGYYID